jgi:membrane protease subunit (stomatin/prohibitin family)
VSTELQIIRQSCLKVAGTVLASRMPPTFDMGNVYSEVTELAGMFVEWVMAPTHQEAVQNIHQTFSGTPQPMASQNAPQAPSSASNGIPTTCPQCGQKVKDNRAANIKRGDQGKPALPELKCGGKGHFVTDNGSKKWIQEIPSCGWLAWKVEDLASA